VTPISEGRFFDSRERYRMFVSTTTEKWQVGVRIGQELEHVNPGPGAFRVFDAGLGDGRVLSSVMRQMHTRYRHVPWVITGKEISLEDVRQTLSRMADRFHEHPETVLVLTNMLYREAPSLTPSTPEKNQRLSWTEVALEGETSWEFATQIRDLDDLLAADWQVNTSEKTGNPVYDHPSVVVIYRKDREFGLRPLIPVPGEAAGEFELIIASQPYRSRTPADIKMRNVIAPLARGLAPGGRMVTVQSIGRDPGAEIVEAVWPGENPFPVDRHAMLAAFRSEFSNESDHDLVFDSVPDSQALFNYELHTMGAAMAESIGTSVRLAAWNAAVYAAQMDDNRVEQATRDGGWAQVVDDALHRHGGLWFNDECFIIRREQ